VSNNLQISHWSLSIYTSRGTIRMPMKNLSVSWDILLKVFICCF
jgi:hypothetical protein